MALEDYYDAVAMRAAAEADPKHPRTGLPAAEWVDDLIESRYDAELAALLD